MHNPDREARLAADKALRRQERKKFIPKVSPSDYHRFIYKCHACLLGFKRRGMLVNHLAKRHPDVRPESVPELNLPILRTQKDYFCQYCDKVYKSSSKRKAHILKYHPGAELPPSARKKDIYDVQGLANSTFSATVGSITTTPQSCQFCHKQYASKAKLLQHQRKKHPNMVAPGARRQKFLIAPNIIATAEGQQDTTEVIQATLPAAQHPEIQTADLLTQAMSELTQTLGEYRPHLGGEYRITTHPGGAPTLVPTSLTSTIELSHLGQALAHPHFQTPGAGSMSPSSQGVTTSLPTLTVVSSQSPQANSLPVSLQPGATAYISHNWPVSVTAGASNSTNSEDNTEDNKHHLITYNAS